jgi:hypothetical protein
MAVVNRKETLVPLKKDQEVRIKRPGIFIGKVMGPRPGDFGLPEEQTYYRVQICAEDYYLSTDLEPVVQPSAGAMLERYSKEWLDELERFNEIGRQFLANPKDENLLRQWAESGTKLGFFIPVE